MKARKPHIPMPFTDARLTEHVLPSYLELQHSETCVVVSSIDHLAIDLAEILDDLGGLGPRMRGSSLFFSTEAPFGKH